ncbi:G-type lectin S-receptor-like serine/threonine-protein kinase At4g27290 isoform X3 [Diospyros lotus]|uniref:G-type lectin S-receptor-like serine/threonine-protein kinase At4g27290 isoform X3 n=1 Tax=Diospyros lotus TaxID=55363 RepID=UPI00225A5A07|nr:G-type lectin S-receptor-like serine/threonine-protein kinase At4g27290 isoform X3 [Diospyros lotus]
MMILALIFFFFCIFSNSLPFFTTLSSAADTLSPNQKLTDGGATLVSAGEAFELGFFSPPNSNNRYVAVWFKNVQEITPIWVANKNSPVADSSGALTITAAGDIVISSNQSNTVWSSNSTLPEAKSPVLQLLDTGNLVVKTDNLNIYLWQSFDHPCDTLVPGMKLGWNLQTRQEWYLTSWKSLQDPSSGDYTYKLDSRGLPQIVLRRRTEVIYRSGPWDGVRFGDGPPMKANSVFNPTFVFNSTHVYYSFTNVDDSVISRFVVSQQDGSLQHQTWNQGLRQWFGIVILQGDTCDKYGYCGPDGLCDKNSRLACRCPDGFTPKLPADWNRMEWQGGCVRRTPLNCTIHQGFRKFSRLKLPDLSKFLVNRSKTSKVDCEAACLRNCECMAYAKTDVSGCVVWFGQLLDVRTYSEGGQDLYVRMAASDLGSNENKKRTAAIASVTAILGVLVLGLISWFVIKKRSAQRSANQSQELPFNNSESIVEENLDMPLFNLSTVSMATDNFSFENKIGEGGFGPVYKGQLPTGQEIAVKKLSKTSGQGLKEFKNEVILISKLQHRNLVRLLGCCIHEEERMLIYEYMPNKSLDLFIFNQTRGTSLNWPKRFDIIVGIARGLLYLHRDSRLRIIHRDLKASNILLDSEMNPKISDFGLARPFGGDQSRENTNRILGTYGYMSPEYAIDGLFSVKSDVFSFGVLVLEIVSSKRNRGFNHPDHELNLLGHAWKLWNEGNPMTLVDALMERPLPTFEVLRCIQMALLCVQQRPEDRPTIANVILMLDNENSNLPPPKQPGFYSERHPIENETSSSDFSLRKHLFTSNEVTISTLHGR